MLKNITETELQLSTQQTNYSDAVNTCKSGLKTRCILESGHDNSGWLKETKNKMKEFQQANFQWSTITRNVAYCHHCAS